MFSHKHQLEVNLSGCTSNDDIIPGENVFIKEHMIGG